MHFPIKFLVYVKLHQTLNRTTIKMDLAPLARSVIELLTILKRVPATQLIN